MNVIQVDIRGRKPIYEQLIDNIKSLVIRGLLASDEQLPSVRSLAGELAINPNTIQKAYAELERQGVIYPLPGRGNFVCSDISAIRSEHGEELLRVCGELFVEIRDAGVPCSRVQTLINETWRECVQ